MTNPRAPRIGKERLREIAARAEAATPAPWTLMQLVEDDGAAKSPERMKEYVSECIAISGEVEFFTVGIAAPDGPDVCHTGNGPTSPWNGDFIAHARQDIPDLLAELASVRAERDQKHELLEAMLFAANTSRDLPVTIGALVSMQMMPEFKKWREARHA